MSDSSGLPASSAWNRGFTPFTHAANNAGTSAPATAGSSWRGGSGSAANGGSNQSIGSSQPSQTNSRWTAAPQTTQSSLDASGSSSSAWRSNRVDKLKSSDSSSGPNSSESTPQLSAQATPNMQQQHNTNTKNQTQPNNEIVYQPSDFGPTQHPNVKWYYLDPQRQLIQPHRSTAQRSAATLYARSLRISLLRRVH